MNEEKKKAVQALKTARGQIDGIIKMIEEERYCIDISNQLLATSAMLKRANLLILEQHMNNCLVEAIDAGGGKEKISEMLSILSKIMDK
ncbi:MAG: metal-sensing transcriptional repressor [Peptostreptococcaceae bacterium]|nr:metal-sensing transcriptional repressor [Peptostreptococcaceae bacterium]